MSPFWETVRTVCLVLSLIGAGEFIAVMVFLVWTIFEKPPFGDYFHRE